MDVRKMENYPLDRVLMDLKYKAFLDTINYPLLLQSYNAYGFSKHALAIIM